MPPSSRIVRGLAPADTTYEYLKGDETFLQLPLDPSSLACITWANKLDGMSCFWQVLSFAPTVHSASPHGSEICTRHVVSAQYLSSLGAHDGKIVLNLIAELRASRISFPRVTSAATPPAPPARRASQWGQPPATLATTVARTRRSVTRLRTAGVRRMPPATAADKGIVWTQERI